MSQPTARVLLLLGFALAQLTLAGAAHAAGGSSDTQSDDGSVPREQQIAARHFRQGLQARDAAWRYEQRARNAKDSESAERFYGKARGRYEVAIESQRKALESAPTLYQAHSSLGYALRKLGRYDEAIASYDRALELEPSYGEAVEYRAEAYLQLGRLQDVQHAWIQLKPVPELAEQLMTAMDRWVEQHRQDAGEIDPAAVEAFASWLDEQKRTASPPTAAADRGRW